MAAAPVNPLLNPSATLTGPALLSAAKALTNAQTQGPLTELARQIAANNAQTAAAGKATSGYFNSLGQFVQSGVNQEGQIGAGLNQTLQGIGGQTQQTLQGLGQAQQQAMLRYSPQSDAQNSLAQPGLGSLGAELARQQGLAAQSSGAFRNAGAVQGANYQGLAASNLGSFAQQGQQDLKGIATGGQLENEPLNAKVANLQATKGSLLASNEGKLRQQEINNQLSGQALGVKVAAIKTAAQTAANAQTSANSRSASSIAAANYRAALAQAGANSRNAASIASRQTIAAANKAAKAVGKAPLYTPTGQRVLSPLQQQRSFGQIDTLRTLIKEGQKAGQSGAQIRQSLIDGGPKGNLPKYNPALIDAAWALDGWGYLTPAQITGLNKLGLIVGSRYPRGKVPPPGKTLGGSVAGVLGGLGKAVNGAI
jgi:hypothetical protein